MPAPDRVEAFAPGRVNLIGEHTDYHDGLCLPFAVRRGVTVSAERRPGGRVEAVAVDLADEDAFDVTAPGPPRRGWRAFVRGTVTELTAAGHELPGVRLRIAGDLPRGAGLASSAALEAALALALLSLAGAPAPDRIGLARLCSRVENTWVGARTGLLDQLAVLCAVDGCALRLDVRDVTMRPVALALGGWTLVTVDSGSRHDHAASGYNARRAEGEAARRALGLASLRDATLDAAARLPDPLARRVRHVVTENARVDAAVAALETDDLPAVGRLLDASHASLRDDYDASVPAVEAAVARVRAAGAAGARMLGGGFGGAVLALLPPGVAAPRGALVHAAGPPARVRSV